jgi:hypothetical protein
MNSFSKIMNIFQKSWTNFQKNHEQNFQILEHFLKIIHQLWNIFYLTYEQIWNPNKF